jgi:hypothetical protein
MALLWRAQPGPALAAEEEARIYGADGKSEPEAAGDVERGAAGAAASSAAAEDDASPAKQRRLEDGGAEEGLGDSLDDDLDVRSPGAAGQARRQSKNFSAASIGISMHVLTKGLEDGGALACPGAP